MSRSKARIASGTSSRAVADRNGTTPPPGSFSTSDDPSAARTDTVRYSSDGSQTSPRGVMEVESIQSAVVGAGRRMRRFAVQTSWALSRGVRATMSNCITLSGRKGDPADPGAVGPDADGGAVDGHDRVATSRAPEDEARVARVDYVAGGGIDHLERERPLHRGHRRQVRRLGRGGAGASGRNGRRRGAGTADDEGQRQQADSHGCKVHAGLNLRQAAH